MKCELTRLGVVFGRVGLGFAFSRRGLGGFVSADSEQLADDLDALICGLADDVQDVFHLEAADRLFRVCGAVGGAFNRVFLDFVFHLLGCVDDLDFVGHHVEAWEVKVEWNLAEDLWLHFQA